MIHEHSHTDLHQAQMEPRGLTGANPVAVAFIVTGLAMYGTAA